MNGAKISLRVLSQLWQDDSRRAELLGLLDRLRDTIGEVAFFTASTHVPLPFETVSERAEQLAGIMPEFRSIGLNAGINHLATFGHLDENLENSLDEPWQRFTDISGSTGRGAYCPMDPRFQQYIRACYRELARARPDFLWIDDDVRMISHGAAVRFTCFCPLCLARFGEETGETWTIERARDLIHNESPNVSREIRAQWVAHNRRILNETFANIRAAVDEVAPELILGFMPIGHVYEGLGMKQWGRTLAGSRNLPVKWRPGDGFYQDAEPLKLLIKAHKIGIASAAIPPADSDIQYEHENFPYQKLRKSETIFVAEAGAALAAGCTGIALNLMGITPNPFDEYLPYFDRMRGAKPFFDRIISLAGRAPCRGLWPAMTPEIWAARIGPGWVSRIDLGAAGDVVACIKELAEIGLPPAYSQAGSLVHVLANDAVRAFRRSELEELLAGAVLVDGPAVRHLQELGLADLAGFEIAGTRDRDTIERFTADPLNGPHAGWWRDCRPSFWPVDSFLLRPLDPQSRVLAELIDFNRAVSGPVMGAFENRLGGRVAVLGYYPWTSLESLSKTTQLKTLCRWLSRDGLPAYVSSYHRIALWCREGTGGQLVIPILNASIDSAAGARLHVLDGRPMVLTRMNGSEEPVHSEGSDGPYRVVELPTLGPWELVLAVCG